MTHIERFTERMMRDQEQRHAWLFKAGEQVRRWKAEDAAKGEPWGESK